MMGFDALGDPNVPNEGGETQGRRQPSVARGYNIPVPGSDHNSRSTKNPFQVRVYPRLFRLPCAVGADYH